MGYEEISEAVDEGKTVHWASRNYIVIQSDMYVGGYAIRCLSNQHMSALVKLDGSMIENEEQFFIGELLFEKKSEVKH
jgi:hypothetical protein